MLFGATTTNFLTTTKMNNIDGYDDHEAQRIARGPPSVAVERAEAARVALAARVARTLGAVRVTPPAEEGDDATAGSSKSASRVLVFGDDGAATLQ